MCDALNEEELRDQDVPWPETMEELVEYIDRLVERPHGYSTAPYAMSMAALATFYYVAKRMGVTRAQAGFADMDFIRRRRHIEGGFYLRQYRDLLYPQYEDDFEQTISPKTWSYLKAEARALLQKGSGASRVKAHWQSIVDGKVPHGFKVEE